MISLFNRNENEVSLSTANMSKYNEITKVLQSAKWLLVLGVLIILLMPFLMTKASFIDDLNFNDTGQIGDTIGGITAPFMSLIGAFLVYFALNAQVKANEIIQRQIDNDKEDKDLNQLYSYLNESIKSFQFKSLPKDNLKNTHKLDNNKEYKGGEAFYNLFNQIRCHYHGTQEELHANQSVSELISILKVMDLLLGKLESSESKSKEIIKVLIKHNFEYKITTRIREDTKGDLDIYHCEACNCNHGLPDELKDLILTIRTKLKE